MLSNEYHLFLDDQRLPTMVDWIDLPKVSSWTIVRSYDEFVRCITARGLPKFISFDHDIDEEQYPFNYPELYNKGIVPYETFKEKSGYDCVKWLIEYCIENKLKFPDFTVHSFNEVGKKNIYKLIDETKLF